MDRRKPGSKHHLITDARGTPLAARLTGAHRHDVTQLVELVDAIPPPRGGRGGPTRRPLRVQADAAYRCRRRAQALRRRGITPVIARPGRPHGSGLGELRWPVERTLSWLRQFKRLRVRFDRRADIHEAFLQLGCALICYRRLVSLC